MYTPIGFCLLMPPTTWSNTPLKCESNVGTGCLKANGVSWKHQFRGNETQHTHTHTAKILFIIKPLTLARHCGTTWLWRSADYNLRCKMKFFLLLIFCLISSLEVVSTTHNTSCFPAMIFMAYKRKIINVNVVKIILNNLLMFCRTVIIIAVIQTVMR